MTAELEDLAVAAMTAEIQYVVSQIESEDIVAENLDLLNKLAHRTLTLSEQLKIADLIDGAAATVEVEFR